MKEQVRIQPVYTEKYGKIYVVQVHSEVLAHAGKDGWIAQGEFLTIEHAAKLARDFDPEFGNDTL